jgi:uncharacterized protein (DUF58 family)
MKIPVFKIQGLIILILSVLAAIFIKNLFIKFLSNTLIFFISYFFLIQWYHYFKTLQKKPQFSEMNYQSLLPFKENSIQFRVDHLFLFFPGFYFKVKLDILENSSRIQQKLFVLEDPENHRVTIPLIFDRHGSFKIDEIELQVLDVFGFTIQKIRMTLNEILPVYPYYLEPVPTEISLKDGGDQVIQTVARINSTDFFENRKYYPGDDLRKLNWKIFAHSQELHIREVEKVPPKVGKINILFAPWSVHTTEYELISSLFYSCVMNYLNNQLSVMVYSPRTPQGFGLTPDNRHQLMDLMMHAYYPYPAHDKVLEEYELFLSFDELKNILDKKTVRNSFASVAYYSEWEPDRALSYLYQIHREDFLLRDLYQRYKKKKAAQLRERLLSGYREDCGRQNIRLEVYRVNYESFKSE